MSLLPDNLFIIQHLLFDLDSSYIPLNLIFPNYQIKNILYIMPRISSLYLILSNSPKILTHSHLWHRYDSLILPVTLGLLLSLFSLSLWFLAHWNYHDWLSLIPFILLVAITTYMFMVSNTSLTQTYKFYINHFFFLSFRCMYKKLVNISNDY